MSDKAISNDWLKSGKCVPCEGGVPPIAEAKAKNDYLPHLESDWAIVNGVQIEREFKFSDFKEAMEFVNKVAEVANKEDHHPDIHISYNKVKIVLTTHAIGGLSENDFFMAAKIESL